MDGTRSRRTAWTLPARGGAILAAILVAICAGSPRAGDFLELPRESRAHLGRAAPRILGRSPDGMVAAAATDAEIRLARSVLASGTDKDGGGADVRFQQLSQTQYLGSDCPPPPGYCTDRCNIVVMVWQETTLNPDGVEVFVDGVSWGTMQGLRAVPGINGVSFREVLAGPHIFRAVDKKGGVSVEAELTVLDQPPFDDPVDLRCESAGLGGAGKCRLVVTWRNGVVLPAAYDIFVDALPVATVQGQETTFVLEVTPGPHLVAVQGVVTAEPDVYYTGCSVETACLLTCVDGVCDPPLLLRPCQMSYGPADASAVRIEWLNGEAPYAVGIRSYLDDELQGLIETDPVTGTPTLGLVAGATQGTHRIGLQGVCALPDLVSPIVEKTMDIRATTPHESPIEGPLHASHDPATGITTVTWSTGDPSLFLDVYLRSGGEYRYLGTLPGETNLVTVEGISPDEALGLQFFALEGGECYGSALYLTASAGPHRYVQGLCNGTGASARPDVSSVIYGLSFLFIGGPAPPCAKACDAGGDGAFDLSDMVYVLSYLFVGGPAPPSWADGNGDGDADPVCLVSGDQDDCAASHEACGD